ncbi:hypothetical protein X805_38080 [Sphaerotilus natans subsp. natans DSM 6575]|uniref:Uncharacterized protein n=1 Tax=Sphaerotilus natans subsp. natans DSM 6575 TaxID=1286631 RepID=A0A059KGX2_9BURK|nr:hypothetical protein X805_38080 [Sphaerotilus natans subsp. natans DSM 6575]
MAGFSAPAPPAPTPMSRTPTTRPDTDSLGGHTPMMQRRILE